MLEHQGSLLTWALSDAPTPSENITAERLPDHRLVYLDYEGPVAGDRGEVVRWTGGTFDWDIQGDSALRSGPTDRETLRRIQVKVESARMNGRVTLAIGLDEYWGFHYEPSNGAAE